MHEQRWRQMRILLDESVPARLGSLLLGHTFTTVPRRGWAGFKNGKLLAAAAPEFDVLVTADKNIEYQQNLSALPIAILVILAASNRMVDLEPMVPAILRALNHLPPNKLQRITA
jgi:predicted nuclease of predicted toxin-antitoxin system